MTAGGGRPGRGGGSSRGGPPCVVLPYAVADGARNMALDEAMLQCAAGGRTLVRLYGWDPWCVSLGRNQPAPARLLGRARGEIRPGVDAVRRPTGGRSVFHGPEITYAVACPDRAWGGPKRLLRIVHGALAEGLRAIGVAIDEIPRSPSATSDRSAAAGSAAGTGSAAGPALSTAACFRDPAPGELTVNGRKLVGSAQRRRGGGLLQHGSILLDDRQALADLEGTAAGTGSSAAAAWAGPPAIGLRETLSATADVAMIVRRLEAALAGAFGPPASQEDAAAVVPALERAAAACLPEHRSAARLWRVDATIEARGGRRRLDAVRRPA